jgi:hypothetical protein
MERFYRGLLGGVSRGEALRTAQLELLRDGKHAHPFFWAAFVLSGDWRAMPKGLATAGNTRLGKPPPLRLGHR